MNTGEHTLSQEANLTATLARAFGVTNLIFVRAVQDAFCRAFEWTAKILMAGGTTGFEK
jgi:hypothetical protein